MRKVIGSSPISSTKKPHLWVWFSFWYGIRDRTRTHLNVARTSAASEGSTEPHLSFLSLHERKHNSSPISPLRAIPIHSDQGVGSRPWAYCTTSYSNRVPPLPTQKNHIHRPSRWLSFCGHSPLFLGRRVKRVSTTANCVKAPLCKGGWQKSLIFDWGIVFHLLIANTFRR